jgi:phosphoribosylformimino-5-aminoimidazole carboxamide ribotide isomerase
MQIIPAIDIIDGKCVRLTEGDYAQKKVYNENPLEVALQFQDAGIQRLHLVDLDGAKAGQIINWKVLELLASKISLEIDFGGGIKKEEDVRIVLNSGASWATVGSVAVKDKSSFLNWIELFGAGKFLLGADVKGDKIAVGGWLETSDVNVYDFIADYLLHGIEQIFCTDISKDGRLEGPSVDLYQTLIDKNKDLRLIASGGVSSMQDLKTLRDIGCAGAIVGKAIYEGRISMSELSQF